MLFLSHFESHLFVWSTQAEVVMVRNTTAPHSTCFLISLVKKSKQSIYRYPHVRLLSSTAQRKVETMKPLKSAIFQLYVEISLASYILFGIYTETKYYFMINHRYIHYRHYLPIEQYLIQYHNLQQTLAKKVPLTPI